MPERSRPRRISKNGSEKKRRPITRRLSVSSRAAESAVTDDEPVEYQFSSILRRTRAGRYQPSPSSADESVPRFSDTPQLETSSRSSGRNISDMKDDSPDIDSEVYDVDDGDLHNMEDAINSVQEFPTKPPAEMIRSGKLHFERISKWKVLSSDVILCKIQESGISFTGACWVKIIRGRAHVLGATLTSDRPPMFIVSAPFAPYHVTVVPDRNEEILEGKSIENWKHASHARDWLHKACIDNINALPERQLDCTENECIVLLAQSTAFDDVRGSTASRMSQGVLRRHYDIPESLGFYLRRAGLPSCSGGIELIEGLTAASSTTKVPKFKLWDNWDRVSQSMAYYIKIMQRPSSLRLLVCGSSGTGKSTMVRCVLNFLLCRHPKVILVDTDVGQPEMNIPGIVAAHVVDTLRPGAPAGSNRGVPLSARFFGDITARENPDAYCRHVEAVVAAARKCAEELDCPIVVNSDGWCSGTGADLLMFLTKCTAPSHVFGMTHMHMKEMAVSDILDFVPMDRAFEIVSPYSLRYVMHSGSILRDLHIAAYFSNELRSGRVREVLLDDVQVVIDGEEIASECYCTALNACIVALAEAEESAKAEDGNVLGVGIVRAIDNRSKTLYIATPLPDDELERCNVLIANAGVHVPSGLFLSVAEKAVQWIKAPYIETEVVSTAGRMKSRTSLQRGIGTKGVDSTKN